MRPIYENETDRRKELATAMLYSKGHVVQQMKKLAPYDVAYVSGKSIKAVAEIKCRNHDYGTFPTYMISADKFHGLSSFYLATKIPTLIIVAWQCGSVGHVKFPIEARFEIGGRIDRNDPMDIEIVAHIPIESFKLLK